MANPIFAFTEKSFIDTLWFAAWGRTDLMGVLYKDSQDGPWQLTVRIRLSNSDDPFDPNDRKDVQSYTGPDGSEETRLKAITKVDSTIEGVSLKPDVFEKLPIQGDMTKFFEILSQQPWAHVKEVPFPGQSSRVH